MATRSEDSEYARTNATGAHPASGSRKLALAGAEGDETIDIRHVRVLFSSRCIQYVRVPGLFIEGHNSRT